MLRAVLVGLLAPLLALFSGSPASAEFTVPYTDYSPVAKGSAKLPALGPENDASCSLAAYWMVTYNGEPAPVSTNSLSLVVTGKCEQDLLYSDEGNPDFMFDGGDCGVSFGGDYSSDGFKHTIYAGNPAPGFACSIVTGIATFEGGCLNADGVAGPNHLGMPDCDRPITLPVGPYPAYKGPNVVEAPPGCLLYTPAAPSIDVLPVPGQSMADWWRLRTVPGLTFKTSWPAGTPSWVSGQNFRTIMVWRRNGTGVLEVGWPGGTNASGRIGYGRSAPFDTDLKVTTFGAASTYTFLGMQITPEYIGNNGENAWPGADGYDVGLPQEVPGGDLGTTKPESCIYYFGDKIAEDTGSTVDEPAGGLSGSGAPSTPIEPPPTAPVVVTPEPSIDGDDDEDGVSNGQDDDDDNDGTPDEQDGSCGGGFSFKDPGTWLASTTGALACIMVVVVQQLVKLVKAVGGIVGAFGALLADLFIPSPGSWGMAELKANAGARPPFSVVGDLAGFGTSMASAYNGGSTSGTLASYSIAGENYTLSRPDFPGFSALYALAQLALLSMTGIGIFNMFSNVIERGQ